MTPLRSRLAVCLAGVILALASCSDEGKEVAMNGNHRFAPEETTVRAGETITFANHGTEPHTVTAYEDDIPEPAAYFASGGYSTEAQARADIAGGLIGEGKSFEVTLDVPGTYEYFCLTHEQDGMRGTIVVER
jgi:plastocyanin